MEQTRTVTQLHELITKTFTEQIGSMWVTGEVSSYKKHNGHIYLEIVEKGSDGRNIIGALNVVILASQLNRQISYRMRQTPNVNIEVGVPLKLKGNLDIFAARGSMSFKVEDIDLEWTLGQLVADKDAVLRKLTNEGKHLQQKRFTVPRAPFKIAVITSVGSAAEADFVDEMRKSEIAFQLLLLNAQVQGVNAPEQIINAMKNLAAMKSWQPDLVVLIRGGGSKNDLATFDTEEVARAVAGAPWPIFTGIGHEIDKSVCDMMANAYFKTPTAVATNIIKQVLKTHQELETLARNVSNFKAQKLENLETSLLRVSNRVVSAAENALLRKEHKDANVLNKIINLSNQKLKDEENKHEKYQDKIFEKADKIFEKQTHFLEKAELIVNSSSIEKVLAKGFSITRFEGKIVKDLTSLEEGSVIETETLNNKITSKVLKND